MSRKDIPDFAPQKKNKQQLFMDKTPLRILEDGVRLKHASAPQKPGQTALEG